MQPGLQVFDSFHSIHNYSYGGSIGSVSSLCLGVVGSILALIAHPFHVFFLVLIPSGFLILYFSLFHSLLLFITRTLPICARTLPFCLFYQHKAEFIIVFSFYCYTANRKKDITEYASSAGTSIYTVHMIHSI